MQDDIKGMSADKDSDGKEPSDKKPGSKKKKIDSVELEASIDKAVKNLSNELDVLLNNKKGVSFKSGTRRKKISIDQNSIRELSKLIVKLKSRHKNDVSEGSFIIDFQESD